MIQPGERSPPFWSHETELEHSKALETEPAIEGNKLLHQPGCDSSTALGATLTL
jgi:hypothetical protein